MTIKVGLRSASALSSPSFLRIDDGWWIRFAANETKSGRPDERPAPFFDVVRRRITTNITVARSVVYWCSITTTLWDETPAAGEA